MYERHLVATTRRTLERITDDALSTVGSVDTDLRGNLVWGVLAQEATGTGVRAFGAFTTHDKVDVFRTLARERAHYAGEELDWTQIEVVIEAEAQLQQQPTLKDSRRHTRIANRAKQDRIKSAQFL